MTEKMLMETDNVFLYERLRIERKSETKSNRPLLSHGLFCDFRSHVFCVFGAAVGGALGEAIGAIVGKRDKELSESD